MEDRELLGFGVVAKVIAERSLGAPLPRRHIALENELGVGGDHQRYVTPPREPGRGAADQADKGQLVHVLRERHDGGQHQQRVATQHHRRGKIPAQALRLPVVGAAALHRLPVHAGGTGIVDLEPVEPVVPLGGTRVLRQGGPEGDERPAVPGPAGDGREQVEPRLGHDLLHRRQPGGGGPHVSGTGQKLPVLPELLRGGRGQSLDRGHQFLPDLLRVPSQRDLDPLHRAEGVHEQRKTGALDVLEEQRRPVLPDDALHQLGDLEVGVDRGGDADQLALALEGGDEVLQAGEWRHGQNLMCPVSVAMPPSLGFEAGRETAIHRLRRFHRLIPLTADFGIRGRIGGPRISRRVWSPSAHSCSGRVIIFSGELHAGRAAVRAPTPAHLSQAARAVHQHSQCPHPEGRRVVPGAIRVIRAIRGFSFQVLKPKAAVRGVHLCHLCNLWMSSLAPAWTDQAGPAPTARAPDRAAAASATRHHHIRSACHPTGSPGDRG